MKLIGARVQFALTCLSLILVGVALALAVSSYVNLRQQAHEAKTLAHAQCVRTRQVGPGLADFLEFYGTARNPNTGHPFFPPAYIALYRTSIPRTCP